MITYEGKWVDQKYVLVVDEFEQKLRELWAREEYGVWEKISVSESSSFSNVGNGGKNSFMLEDEWLWLKHPLNCLDQMM